MLQHPHQHPHPHLHPQKTSKTATILSSLRSSVFFCTLEMVLHKFTGSIPPQPLIWRLVPYSCTLLESSYSSFLCIQIPGHHNNSRDKSRPLLRFPRFVLWEHFFLIGSMFGCGLYLIAWNGHTWLRKYLLTKFWFGICSDYSRAWFWSIRFKQTMEYTWTNKPCPFSNNAHWRVSVRDLLQIAEKS